MGRSRKATPKVVQAEVELPAPKSKKSQSLADYLRRQRSLADISLRKIIERSGIPGVVLKELEGGLQQRAVLETVPTTTLDHDLAGDAVEVDADAAAKQHIHVLERNARHVRTRQPGQRVECRLERSLPGDASEISVEVERTHRQSIESTP